MSSIFLGSLKPKLFHEADTHCKPTLCIPDACTFQVFRAHFKKFMMFTQPEARGRGREEQPHIQGAVAEPEQEGLEELFHVQSQARKR